MKTMLRSSESPRAPKKFKLKRPLKTPIPRNQNQLQPKKKTKRPKPIQSNPTGPLFGLKVRVILAQGQATTGSPKTTTTRSATLWWARLSPHKTPKKRPHPK